MTEERIKKTDKDLISMRDKSRPSGDFVPMGGIVVINELLEARALIRDFYESAFRSPRTPQRLLEYLEKWDGDRNG